MHCQLKIMLLQLNNINSNNYYVHKVLRKFMLQIKEL